MKSPLAGILLFLALSACSGSDTPDGGSSAETIEELLRQLRGGIEELQARPEHQAQGITVQHVLVAVEASKIPGVTRAAPEAERLAAEVFSNARAGADFGLLVKNHSDDPGPGGLYVLVAQGGKPPETWDRTAMVPAFGNVGWRLAVGEIGVAPYDGETRPEAPQSPFGYHIIKRLK